MRRKIFHLIILIGALTNAYSMSTMDMPLYIIIGTSVLYIGVFELMFALMEPRFIRAERQRNLSKFPFLRELINAKKAKITLKDGTVHYNATFDDYINKKDAKTLRINVATVKTKKEPDNCHYS